MGVALHSRSQCAAECELRCTTCSIGCFALTIKAFCTPSCYTPIAREDKQWQTSSQLP
jgi:hypothetical protein